MKTARNTWKTTSLNFLATFLSDKSKNDTFELLIRILGEIQLIICIIQTGTDYPGAKVSEFTSTIINFVLDLSLLGLRYDSISISIIIPSLTIYFLIWIAFTVLTSVFKGQSSGIRAGIVLMTNCLVLLHTHMLAMYINLILFTKIKSKNYEMLSVGEAFAVILFSILNNLCGAFGARFGYCKLNGKYSMGMRIPDHGTITFLYKFAYAIVRTFMEISISRITRVILTILYHIFLFRDFGKSPFHHLKTYIIFYNSYTFQIAWTVGTLMNIIQLKNDWSFLIYFCLILNCIFLKITHSHIEKLIIRVAAQIPAKLKTPESYYLKLQVAEYLIQEGQNLQLVRDYKIQDLLFTQIFKSVDYAQSPIKISELLETQISVLYEIGIKNLHDDNLRLMKAYRNIQNKNHPSFKVMLDLLKLKAFSTNFDIAVISNELIERYKIVVSKKTIAEQAVDVKEVFDFYDSKYQFLKDIHNSTHSYIQFWKKHVNEEKLVHLFEKAVKMTHKSKKIQETWRNIQNVVSKSNKLEALNYTMYLYYVRSAPYTAFKILNEKIFKVKRDFIRQNALLNKSLVDIRAITFLVDIQYDGTEKLIFATNNAEQLGYKLFEYKQMVVGDLFPGIYKSSKPFSLLEYGEKNRGSSISKSFPMFIKSKHCHLWYTFCYICPLVRDSRLLYLLIVIPEREVNPSNMIILSEDLTVECWTEAIGRVLKLNAITKDPKGLDRDEKIEFTVKTIKREKNLNPQAKSSKLFWQSRDLTISGTLKKDLKFLEGPKFDVIPEPGKIKKLKLSHHNTPVSYEISREDFPGSKSIALKFKRFVKGRDSIDSNVPDEHKDQDPEMVRESSKFPMVRINTLNTLTHEDLSDDIKSGVGYSKEDIKKRKIQPGKKVDSISSLALSRSDGDSTLEESLYHPKVTNKEKFPHYGVIVYIILTIFLMFVFLISSLGTLDNLPKISRVAGAVYLRHNFLWEWVYYTAATVELQQQGLIIGREGMGTQEYYSTNIFFIEKYAELILDVDLEIQKIIPVFEEDLKQNFFRNIKLVSKYLPELPEYADFFNLDYRFEESSQRLMNFSDMDITLIPHPNPNLNFINQNVLDDQYILEESFYPLIKEDIQRKVAFLQNFCLANNIVILALGLLLFFRIFKEEKSFMKIKLRFCEALSRIKQDELDFRIRDVEKFYQHGDNIQKLSEQIDRIIKNKVAKNEKKSRFKISIDNKNNNTTRMNTVGINRRPVIHLILIFLIITFILGVSFGIQGILTNSSDNILNKIDISIEAAIIFNKLCSVTIPLYQYISYNGNLTIKHEPYTKIFNEFMNDLSHIQAFYFGLINSVDLDLQEELLAQYNTDLCNFVSEKDCLPELRSIVKNGALSFYTYVLKLASTIKQDFDLSNHTFEAKFEVLSSENYINMELSSYYLPNTTQSIQNIMQTQVLRTISSYRSTMLITFGVYCFFFSIFLFVVWGPIWAKMREQRMMIYEMMKMIPLDVIKENVYIKYFWNDFAGDGSVKIIKDH